MKLTEEQIDFLNKVCAGNWTLTSEGKVDVIGSVIMDEMGLTEIPFKFGVITGGVSCNDNNLTTLKNYPDKMGYSYGFYFRGNNLTNYFKSIKEEDFPHWRNFYWKEALEEYPFLINIRKKYCDRSTLKSILNKFPLTKLYLE